MAILLEDLRPQIDSEALTAPLRAVLACEEFVPLSWDARPLGAGVTNPVTAGLWRVTGSGRGPRGVKPWTLVLKAVRLPPQRGDVDMGSDADPRHWNYWRRESHIYRSDLLRQLPDGLAAPACYGIMERSKVEHWLWLEHIDDAYGGAWPFAVCEQATELLGRFNGDWSRRTLPDLPWLSVGLLRQWSAALPRLAPRFCGADSSAIWRHPQVLNTFGKDAAWLPELLRRRHELLDRLDELPQTLCHRDASVARNFMARWGSNGRLEIVALDWALAGVGPIGEDLAQTVAEAIHQFPTIAPQTVDRQLFASYLRGLRGAGMDAEPRTVRWGFVASYALRWVMYQLVLLNDAVTCPRSAVPNNHVGGSERRAPSYLAEIAGEALAMLP